MNYYYLEHDLFPATYNFKDDDNDALPSGWTQMTATGVVAASWQSHKKVLKCTSTGGGLRYRLYQQFTAQADGDIEFWMGTTDATNVHGFYLTKTTSLAGANIVAYIYVLNDVLYARHGDGAAGFIDINMGALTDNTLAHVRVHFDTATDKISVWRDGTNYIDAENFPYDNVFAADELNTITLYGPDVAGAIGYWDALGYSWDANYEIGDNKEVDWHTYNKEQITDIIREPTIAPRLDAYWIGSFVVRDFEGALFSSWHDRDFNKILIEDASANVLFRGILIKKTFTKNSLVLTIAGIGIMLDWQPFGSDGYVNYILAEGLVKAPISNDSILQVKTNAGADFGWDVDWWIKEGRDLGVLIVDESDVNKRTWDSSAISQSGGTVIAGNNASTLTFMDDNYYNVRDVSHPNLDLKITPVIDGVAVDDTDYLKWIEIQYNFRLKITAEMAWIKATVRLQILKDTEWITIAKIYDKKYNGMLWTSWETGVPIDVAGGNGKQRVIEGADSTLQKYFNKTGATYSSLKGLKFILTGQGASEGSAEIHIDFIKVRVGYASHDISPIMEKITDSAATSLTCSNVSAWDETGVVEDDGFKIGQNMREILQGIASESGLSIGTIPTWDLSSTILRPSNDLAPTWDCSGADHWDAINDDVEQPDGDPGDDDWIFVSDGQELLVDRVQTEGLSTDNTYIDNISVWVYGKCGLGGDEDPQADIYINGAWQGYKTVNLTTVAGWHSVNWGSLNLPVSDIGTPQIRFKATAVFGVMDYTYIYTAYMEVNHFYTWNKYLARKFIGAYCMEPLKAICKLVGAHWYEDYENDRIVVLKKEHFIDSGIDLTQAGHEWEWIYEDDCNQVRSFYVFGNAENEIFAKAIDESVSGYISKQIIDETISTTADAQEIADAQLALLNSKRPSFKIPLAVDNVNLQLGKTVDVTFVRPTIAKTNYVIRKIERSKKGISGIKTVIYCGLGESSPPILENPESIVENITKNIRENAFRSHKALRDRLISP